jgi:hypothetical protein
MKSWLFLAALAASIGASAQASAERGDWRLSYAGYRAGVPVVSLTVDFHFSPAGYGIAMRGQTTGLARLFYAADWQTVSIGAWAEGGVVPSRFETSGTFDGKSRTVVLGFAGGSPVIRTRQPADDGEHEPVPPGTEAGAIDDLGAMAMAIRQEVARGACEGRVKTFDGRKVEQMELRSAAPERLEPTSRSIWQGTASRCELAIQVLAGFLRDDPTRAHARRNETVWLAPPLAEAPPLPVRMTATAEHLGHITLYLTGATRLGAQAQ